MIKLVAVDLDGTLLRDNKELSKRNEKALYEAAEKGILIVPATGRLGVGMPQVVQDFPFLHYVIGVNGAVVRDVQEGKDLHRAELTSKDAARLFSYVREDIPAIWGCYKDGQGLIEEEDYAKMEYYVADENMFRTVGRLHHPVKGLKDYLMNDTGTIQKMQLFFRDLSARSELLESASRDFPDLCVSTSLPNNIEFNAGDANKGAALSFLCDHLGIPVEESMAFGDGTNDLTMIRAAGTGVAMKNACREVLEAADRVTLSNEEDGVAYMLEKLVLS